MRRSFVSLMLAGLTLATATLHVTAVPVDFRTFTPEDFPQTSGFNSPNWVVTPDGTQTGESGNSAPTVFYGTQNIHNTRITGNVDAAVSTGEDDIFGFVLGFNPGDATNPAANYAVVDWKGDTQNFNFSDVGGAPQFHNLTPGATARRGLALSMIEGAPNADEMWGHTNYAANPTGRMTELQRGASLGLADYVRPGGDSSHDFEILYEPHRVRVFVDGNLEIDQTGSFPDGRLGLFENHQNPGAIFRDFDIEPLGTPSPLPTPEPPATVVTGPAVTSAMPVDFNTFTQDDFARTSGFSAPNWSITGGGATAEETGNSSPTVLYSQENIHNTRIIGTVDPTNGTGEDDVFGFVLGYGPGSANDPNAEYLLIDWKGNTQDFNFSDLGGPAFHDLTPGGTAAGGLAISRVKGMPNADELWGHSNYSANPDGRVTELMRAANLGTADYGLAPHQFEILYEPNRVQVWVNGLLEIDLAGSFPDGRFGVFESHQSPGATFSDFVMAPAGDPRPPQPKRGVGAAMIEASQSTSNAGSAWTVVNSTMSPNTASIVSPNNVADAEVAFDGLVPVAGQGVMIATVAQNGPRDNGAGSLFHTVEAPANHTGWGRGQYGLATSPTPNGGEGNVNVAVAYFPFQDGWIGGHITPGGGLLVGNGVTASDISQLAPPVPSSQNGLYDVNIPGVNSATDGMLFTVGSSNEDNISAAIPFDGGWRISVRDNGSAGFTSEDEFEDDDVSFLYMPIDAMNLFGGYVTGFDGSDMAILDMQAGTFTLAREGTGQYRLTLAGESAQDGMLMLTPAEQVTLIDNTIAPSNFFMSYETDGDDFLINSYQTVAGSTPVAADADFYFAYVSFLNPPMMPTDTPGPREIPEPTGAALVLLGLATLARRRRQS